MSALRFDAQAEEVDRRCKEFGRLTQTRVTVISFWVRVPVLSEQMTVAEPSVSTDDRRRMSTWRLTISLIPSARLMVTTAGSPSGTAAIARLTAIINRFTSCSSPAWVRILSAPISLIARAAPMANTRAHTTRAAIPSKWPSWSRRCCKGVVSSSTLSSMLAIRPSWVFMPVSTTTPRPRP